jgi:antibiotic biosynthesis monooxygenase (ABM) superfamily enzyme
VQAAASRGEVRKGPNLTQADGGDTRPVHRHVTKVLIIVFAWLAAHLIVMVLLMPFGARLASQPPAVRALVAIGVLLIVMAHVVEPRLGRRVGRWFKSRRSPERVDFPRNGEEKGATGHRE